MTSRVPNKLSPGRIDALPDGNHGDGLGLSCLVTDGGKRRSWVFRFTSPVISGKVREMGLGSAAAVTLKQARAERDRLRTLIRDGVDPLEARREVAEAQRRKAVEEAGRKTLRATADAYIAQKQREWGKSSLLSWQRFAKRNIEPIAACAIADIGLAEIKLAVTPWVDAGLIPAARSTQSRIQALLDYAAEHGWRSEDKRSRFSQIAPKARKGEAPKRHPALNPDRDADAIRSAITKLRASTAMSAIALEFVILTAVRVSEGVGATWEEIDLDKALWVIPAARMKMGREHSVPLSGRAMEILRALHEHRGRNRHVFPGIRPGKSVARTTVYDICEEMTGGNASVHGWRSTFRSWAAEAGVEFELAEEAIAHAKGAIVAAYQRSGLVERRRPVMERWAQFLSGEEPTADIIPLRRA